MRIPELDGLRGFSILVVLLSHAWLQDYIPGGFGVTIFFFISGFIITKLMLREHQLSACISMRAFYLRRIFRIMPALLVFVIACMCAFYYNDITFGWLEIAAALLFFSNYLAVFGSINAIGLYSPLSTVWSLSVEEHFYLLWPIAFLLVDGRRELLIKIVVSLIFIVLAWRCYLVFGVGLDYLPHDRLYKGTDTRFDSILYGVLFALLANSSGFSFFRTKWFPLFCGYALLASSFFFRNPEFRESFRYSVQGLGLFLVFGNLMDSKSFLSRLLRSDFFQFFGRISYSLYLYHWLIFVLVEYYFGDYPFLIRVALMLPLSVFFGWASYRWIECPGLQFGRHFIASRNF